MTLLLWVLFAWLAIGITLAGLVVIAAPWLPTVPVPPEPEPDADPQTAMLDADYDDDDDPRLRTVWAETVEYYRGKRK